jgi:hypothetical protein
LKARNRIANGCSCSERRASEAGVALLLALLLLVALYASATGIFLAARAELRIGLSHAAAFRASRVAEAALETWLATSEQPATASYEIGGGAARLEASRLLVLDSAETMYRVVVRATVGTSDGPGFAFASRRLGVLGRRIMDGPVRVVPGSRTEHF